MRDLCVAHLVRASNGVEPFRRFLDSYRRHPAGAPHDLLIIFKGFADEPATAPFRAVLADTPFHAIEVPDEGFDIGPYRQAALQFDYRYFCFLNSFSTILAEGWLAKLRAAAALPGFGIAGATGSWGSHYTSHVTAWWRERSWRRNPKPFSTNSRHVWSSLILRWKYRPFPNAHVRTNAFLIEREVFLGIKCSDIRQKDQAYEFESGRGGLSEQVRRCGRTAVVVGRDGQIFKKEAWPLSRTFWSADQENLLISDNQTRHYETGNDAVRRDLRKHAWESFAEMAPDNSEPDRQRRGDSMGGGPRLRNGSS